MDALSRAQTLNHATRATLAAGFYLPDDTLVAVREDVGRHSALDKLPGGFATAHMTGQSGAILVTSRISIELVQKDRMSDPACHLGAYRSCSKSG